ncbi:MAG: copper resistance protein B [Deferrisomatales bacterium]
MTRWLAALLLAAYPWVAGAETAPSAEPAGRLPADYREVETRPEVGEGVRKYAEDAQAGAPANFGIQPVHDDEIFATFLADRFEVQGKEGNEILLWDVSAWIGEDYNKLYLESEAEKVLDGPFEELTIELLYGRTMATFWDLRAGVRHDFRPLSARTFAVVGFLGLAPQWFEVEGNAYLSEDGDVSFALEVEYDLLLTQRTILQPRLETSAAVQEVEEYGVGSGFNAVVLGLRLRYEIRRQFAPYVGLSWNRKLGRTADLAEDEAFTALVAGVRFWL